MNPHWKDFTRPIDEEDRWPDMTVDEPQVFIPSVRASLEYEEEVIPLGCHQLSR